MFLEATSRSGDIYASAYLFYGLNKNVSIFTPLLSIKAFFCTKEVFFVKILQSIYSQLLLFDENVSKQRVI